MKFPVAVDGDAGQLRSAVNRGHIGRCGSEEMGGVRRDCVRRKTAMVKHDVVMSRRTALRAVAGAAVTTALLPDAAAQLPDAATQLDAVPQSDDSRKSTGMGLVIYDCSIRRRWMQQRRSEFNLFEPLTFLQHCRKREDQ